jgi:pyruvate dehydrogenase (quinone)
LEDGITTLDMTLDLYDAKADNTPVIAIAGTTCADLMNSNYQQDVNLLQLYSDVAVYNDMIS